MDDTCGRGAQPNPDGGAEPGPTHPRCHLSWLPRKYKLQPPPFACTTTWAPPQEGLFYTHGHTFCVQDGAAVVRAKEVCEILAHHPLRTIPGIHRLEEGGGVDITLEDFYQHFQTLGASKRSEMLASSSGTVLGTSTLGRERRSLCVRYGMPGLAG